MMRRFILPMLLLVVAAGLAVLPDTAAITRTIDRPPSALMGPDPGGALSLVSFAGDGFSVNDGTFSSAGSLTNRFSVPITVTMTATPTITQSCQSVDPNGVCTASVWSLSLCLATDQTSNNAKQCRGGQNTQLSFTGADPGTPAGQSFRAVTLSVGQTLYLFVRGGPKQISSTSRMCGQAVFGVTGTTSTGGSVQLSSGTNVPRRQIYRNGSGCP